MRYILFNNVSHTVWTCDYISDSQLKRHVLKVYFLSVLTRVWVSNLIKYKVILPRNKLTLYTLEITQINLNTNITLINSLRSENYENDIQIYYK